MKEIEKAKEALEAFLDDHCIRLDYADSTNPGCHCNICNFAIRTLASLDSIPMSVEDFAIEAKKIAKDEYIKAFWQDIRHPIECGQEWIVWFRNGEVRANTSVSCLAALRKAMEK